MSDFDDDLLALAEGSAPKKSKSTKSKRKREVVQSDADSASDMDMSNSDSDAPPPTRKPRRGSSPPLDKSVPYPLEGKYKDHKDKEHLLSLTEIEREGILEDRLEEISRLQQREEVAKMARAKDKQEGKGKGQDSSGEESEDDYGADKSRAGRDRKTTGTSNEKRKGLEKLKQSRLQKGNKDKKRDDDDDDYDAPPKRAFESDEDDDPYADDDDDDKPAKKPVGKPLKASQSKELESAGTDDYRGVVLPRSRLARLCPAPWFESWLVDGYVRYLVGQNQGENQYRICRVKAVEDVPDRVYRFENASTSKRIVIEHGKLEKTVTMEGVSDSPPTDREINRLKAQLVTDNIDQLTVKEAAKLKERLDERTDYIMTEADLSAHLAKNKNRAINPAASKAKLVVERDFARQTGNAELLATVEAKLAELEKLAKAESEEQARTRKLNERNRQQNAAEVKKAEGIAQDHRRRQAAALARGDASVKVDPSARVKTLTRLTYDSEGSATPSRPSTPAPADATASTSKIVPAADRPKATRLEDMVANRVTVDVDLDF